MKLRKGFTLIELSIVLVIIGLIVGGILAGADLIKAAEIRATISQIEKYNTSVNTFKLKYGYLPGDIPTTRATQLGFFTLTGGGITGYGDGDGLIYGAVGRATGETFVFWRHLSEAQMIDGNYGTTASGAPLATNGELSLTAGQIHYALPPAKIGRGNFFIATSLAGFNYFEITEVNQIDNVGPGSMWRAGTLTPIETHQIDSKIDDGLPLTGKAYAVENGDDMLTSAGAGNGCIVAPNAYDIGSTNGNTPVCQLAIRTPW